MTEPLPPTPDLVEQIDQDIASVAAFAGHLDESLLDVESLTVEQAATMLAQLRGVIKSLQRSDAALERWIATVFDDQHWWDPIEVGGVGLVEVRRSKNRRRWDHEAAARDWADAYMKTTEGVIPPLGELLAEFRKAASVSGWKVGGFKAVGLDVDDYCESSPAAPRVDVTPHETGNGWVPDEPVEGEAA